MADHSEYSANETVEIRLFAYLSFVIGILAIWIGVFTVPFISGGQIWETWLLSYVAALPSILFRIAWYWRIFLFAGFLAAIRLTVPQGGDNAGFLGAAGDSVTLFIVLFSLFLLLRLSNRSPQMRIAVMSQLLAVFAYFLVRGWLLALPGDVRASEITLRLLYLPLVGLVLGGAMGALKGWNRTQRLFAAGCLVMLGNGLFDVAAHLRSEYYLAFLAWGGAIAAFVVGELAQVRRKDSKKESV